MSCNVFFSGIQSLLLKLLTLLLKFVYLFVISCWGIFPNLYSFNSYVHASIHGVL